MFYSQMLLSKKGPLGTIWIAAHFHKKLKKEQVNQTNISSSVDKILHDEVPVVTYRILGFLLLGVVRIYSKKVEYLFHDCRDALSKLGDASSGRRAKLSIEGLRVPSHSIALPERFELDAFNLGVLENQKLSSDPSLRSPEEIMLKDTGNENRVRFGSFGKYHHEEDPSHSEARTPVRDILPPDFMDIDMGVSSFQSKRILDLGVDNFHENRFFLEECLEPLILGEAEEELGLNLFGKDLQTKGQQLNHSAGVNLEEETPAITKPVDTLKHVEAEMTSIREPASSESRMRQSTKEHPPPITVDLTPHSKLPGHHGDDAAEVMAVCTPAAKERTRVLRKRKRLYDNQIIVPNEMFKNWISDSHDLVCKRKKAPHTTLRVWKAHKISNLPLSFTETLIPSNLVDFRGGKTLLCEKVHRTQEKGQTVPSTPPVHSTSVASHLVQDVPIPDVLEPATPTESMEKGRSPSEDHRFDFCLTDEETSTCYGESQRTSKSSDSLRTRDVAEYLYKKFEQNKRQKKEKVIRLSQISKGKSKKERARLFYEILVLSTKNYIEVRQDIAYDDILVLETPVLEMTFEAEAA